jgi:membrane protease YdiL (CAAX protease family)
MAKNNLRGIDSNFIQDALIGLFSAITLLFMSTVSPFIGAIGIPSVSASIATSTGRWMIVVLLAPLFEEIFFRTFVNDFFYSKLSLSKFKIGYFISAIISSSLFAIFHLTAYSGSLSAMQGSFISAFLVGMLFQYMSKWTNSNASNIVAHAILNAYILSKLVIVLG